MVLMEHLEHNSGSLGGGNFYCSWILD
jgi:hypothetical protein